MNERQSARTDRLSGVGWLRFLAIIVVLILYALFGTLAFGWEVIKTPAEYATARITTVLVPVVTLVLGYYFGTSERAP